MKKVLYTIDFTSIPQKTPPIPIKGIFQKVREVDMVPYPGMEFTVGPFCNFKVTSVTEHLFPKHMKGDAEYSVWVIPDSLQTASNYKGVEELLNVDGWEKAH